MTSRRTKWTRRQMLQWSGAAPVAALAWHTAAGASRAGADWAADQSRLRGPMLFVPTPFRVENGRTVPDYDGMAGNVAILSRHRGAYTLCICGGTGEFDDLQADEIVGLTRAAAGTKGRAPLIVGVGGATTSEACRRAEALQKAGADALLGMPSKGSEAPSQEDMQAYFRDLLKAVDIGVLPYRSARLPMEKETILALAEQPNFAALKSSGKEAEWYRDLFQESGGRLAIFPGSDFGAPYWHLAGCAGYTTGLANLTLQRSVDYWAMLEAGRYKEAVKAVEFLRPLQAFRSKHGTAMLKAGLELLGGAGGPVRKSMKVLTPEERAELRKLMQEAGTLV